MFRRIFFISLLILVWVPLAFSVGPTVPPKGVYCWVPNPETDISKYTLFVSEPGGNVATIDAGKPTVAPAPPTTEQACPPNTIGILRDQTGKVDGQYSLQIEASNTSGKTSLKSEAYPFVLSANLNLVPPVAPSGQTVK